MFVVTTILCLFFLAVFYYFAKIITCEINNYVERTKIPGPPSSYFGLGNVAELYTSPENIFNKLREWAKLYYPIFHLKVLHIIGVFLQHPDDFELVLSNSKHIEKSPVYHLLQGWLGTGLLTSGGQKWLKRRKILTPAFHFSILQQFVNVFNEETEDLVKTLKDLCNQPYVNINTHVTQFTLKTIVETAMGTKLKFNNHKEVAYKQAIIDIGDILMYRLLRSWFMNNFINLFSPRSFQERKAVKVLHNFTREVIVQREKTFQKIDATLIEDHEVYKRRKRLAMLDLLITAKNEEKVIDNDGICEEVDTFMFEGHDTTSVALGFAFMLIACNRNVQDLIVEELVEVLGDLSKKPSYDDLQMMKYLERVIKEVLRLYPSVHFISRQIGEELTTTSDYNLPKGTMVHLLIYDLHHNPDIYPDPENFDPDRFLPENCKNRHPFAYVPFSAGPRNCIGQKFAMLELKTAICGVLANFVLEPIDTPSTIALVIDLVLRTKDGIKVKFVPRD